MKPASPAPSIGAASPALEALGDGVSLVSQIAAIVDEGLIVYDRELRYVLWNPFMEKLTGQPAAEVLGKRPDDIHPFVQATGIDRLLRQALSGETSATFDLPYTSASTGVSAWVSGRALPLRNPAGEVVGVLSVVRDITEQRRSAEAAQDNAARYRALAESTPDAVFVINREDRIAYVNPSAAVWCRRPPEELVGQSRSMLFPPDVADRQGASLARVFETGQPVHTESAAPFPDGARWMSTWLTPIRNEAGEIVAVQGISRDITERRKTEEALRVSEARYRRLAENINDVIWTMDFDLRFTDVSQSVVRLSGWTAEDLLHHPVDAILSPESARFVRETAARELAPEELRKKDPKWSMLLEVEERRKDGSRVWVEVQVGLDFDETGKPAGLLGVTRNITERHRARVELERSLSLLTATLEATADGILVVDLQGTMITFNRQFVDMWRLPPEIVAGADHSQVMEAVRDQLADPEAFHARVAEIHAQPEVESHDLIEFKDGRVFERLSKPQRVGGQILGRVCSFRDVTEQRRVEAILRLQSAALASAANGIVLTDHKGRIVWVNPAFTRLTGYTAAEAAGQNPRLLKSGQHEGLFYREMWAAIAAGQVWHGELVNRRKDGSIYTEEMTITPVRGATGDVTHFVAIKQDVSARKRMEAELRQSRERFLAIFQSSPTPIAITTLDEGRYLDVNEAFLRMMGYGREEVLGRTVADLRVWEKPEERERLRQLLAAHGAVENFESRFCDKTGRVHDALASVKVVQLGQQPSLIFISHDITERKSLEAQLRQAQKMESIGTLAGGVAHDFNNILTLIHGHTSLLLAHEGWPAECGDSLQQLIKAAEQAGNLTRQLLTFSRKQPMQRRRIDLNEVVANLTKMLRRIIGEDVSLELKYSPQHLPVLADVGMLEQLLMNLAVNARDAMPAGGLLVIATDQVQVAPARQPAPLESAGTDFVRLCVRDTGCGIPPENLSRIFDPFFTTKEVGKGTGLGLATVHGIAQQHQGWVEVESEVNVGTTFSIYLPVETRGVEPSTHATAALPVRGGTETIFLVEDDASVRTLARQILEHYGYTVIEADCGRTALALWPEHAAQVALLLTDMVMPGGISGWQLAEEICRSRPALKVVFTSGYSQDALERDLTARKGVAFLQKPYPPQVLAQAIRDCLDGK